jgi:hypothetical protein
MGRLFLGSVFFFGVAVLGVQARGETKVQYTWLIDPVVGASLTGAMPKTMEAGGVGSTYVRVSTPATIHLFYCQAGAVIAQVMPIREGLYFACRPVESSPNS